MKFQSCVLFSSDRNQNSKRFMKKILITFFFILIISCSQQNRHLQIHECEFILAESVGNPFNSVDTYKKWIENKQDAMNSKIQFEDLKLK